MNIITSKHPFDAFIPRGSTRLIIGTIPPFRFCQQNEKLLSACDVRFYYGSEDNNFWQLIGKVFNTEFLTENSVNAINERKKFLELNYLGITDLVEECTHKDKKSSDKDLIDISYKDIVQLLDKNPSIATLIYTSEKVKQQMNGIVNGYHSINQLDRKKQNVIIEGKNYNVRILYSPSPSGIRRLGKDGAKKRLEQYKEFLK